MPKNTWIEFLKKHGGKGYTRKELAAKYNSKRSPVYKSCRDLLKRKISKNMREYKSGRYSSPKQAIAVSYSQVARSSPKCKRSLKKK